MAQSIAMSQSGFSVGEYLELEEQAEEKHEYWHGQIVAMAGNTSSHSMICANLIEALNPKLRRKGCRSYTSDLKVAVTPSGPFCYPDFSAACSEPQFLTQKQTVLLNPTLIIEVLSRSTEAHDRGVKFEYYRSIASVRQIVFVSQYRVHIDVYSKGENGWLLTSYRDKDEEMILPVLECAVQVAAIYEGVLLPTDQQQPWLEVYSSGEGGEE